MKLLTRAGENLVFLLRPQEHRALESLARLGATTGRPAPSLTRGDAQALPADANETFAAAMADTRAAGREFVTAILADPDRCRRGKGGFGLTLRRGDAEVLLQALNDIKLAQWEILGCPDLEAGDTGPLDEHTLPRFWAIETVNLFQGTLLRALAEPD